MTEKITARNIKDGSFLEYIFDGDIIRGQFYFADGCKMADGQIWIDFSWTHGKVTKKNFRDVIAEDASRRWNYELEAVENG